MTVRYLVSVAILGVSAIGSAIAAEDEQPHSNVAIAISALDGEQMVDFSVSGDGSGFDLHDMQEGENRSIIDDSGRTILVTRETDGFRFDIDGESLKVPAFDSEHHGAVFIGDSGAENVEVHVMNNGASNANFRTLRAHPAPGTMIMTEKPLDDATRQAIESLLQSAGHDGEVRFVDHEGIAGNTGGYKVIRREVELGQH